jgi:hypothetical protein
MDGVHPDTINHYYGVDGEEQRQLNGETGAGHMADEDYEPGDLDSSDQEVKKMSKVTTVLSALSYSIGSQETGNIISITSQSKSLAIATHLKQQQLRLTSMTF